MARHQCHITYRFVSLSMVVAAALMLSVVALARNTSPTTPTAQAAASMPDACASDARSCSERIVLPSGRKLTVYRNTPLAGSKAATAALIVVHDQRRDPIPPFTDLVRAADTADIADRVLILAPRFATTDDRPASDEPRWTATGWIQGADAEGPRGISSFAAMDQLLTTVADKSRFPNLTRVTVAGHSAGAQFVQRYAAFTLTPASLHETTVSYVVANPSSYLYLHPIRPDKTRPGYFTVPDTSCPYDDYKYGLRNRSGYPGRLPDDQVRENIYPNRSMTYLLGERDTGQTNLDTSCAAMLQGSNRLERGKLYIDYLQSLYPQAARRHRLVVVPGIGHDAHALLTSPPALATLLGTHR